VQFTSPPDLPGIVLVEPAVHGDHRGFFLESYHQARFAAAGLDLPFVQDNHSRSAQGVLRGLHFQHPRGQGKLVRVVRGEVFDVAVDIRLGSPTFGRWFGARLSEANRRQLYIPPGFAHGFVVTAPEADVLYKCTEFYHPEHDHALCWNDPRVGVRWPVGDPTLSAKDAAAPTLEELERQGVLPRYDEG
jgi:dTDP-4-dehydrorhamnose 3,5-epimerase